MGYKHLINELNDAEGDFRNTTNAKDPDTEVMKTFFMDMLRLVPGVDKLITLGMDIKKIGDTAARSTKSRKVNFLKVFSGITSKIENKMGFDIQNWEARDHLSPKEILTRLIQTYGYIPPFDPGSPILSSVHDRYLLKRYERFYKRQKPRLVENYSDTKMSNLGGGRVLMSRQVMGMPKAVQEQMERILGVDFMGLWEYLQTQWGLEVESR